MNSAPRSSRIRQTGSLLALAVVCVLAVIGISQCKYGPDKVTGVNRGKQSNPASNCIRQCTDQYGDSLEAENKLHKNNLKACGAGDDDDDDGAVLMNPAASNGGGDDEGQGDPACIAAEKARHKAALDRIKAGQKACIDGCHHQGGGSGR